MGKGEKEHEEDLEGGQSIGKDTQKPEHGAKGVPKPIGKRKQRDDHGCTNTHIMCYTHIHIYIYIHVCVCLRVWLRYLIDLIEDPCMGAIHSLNQIQE